MFASASGAYRAGSLPAFHVNTKSTAYSGSTATSASIASARPAETSSCTTSAAQASMNAAPTTATPKITAASSGSGWRPPTRTVTAGSVVATAAAIATADRERDGATT